MNSIMRKFLALNENVRLIVHRIFSAFKHAVNVSKYKIRLRLLINKRNHVLLFSDVGQSLNNDGKLSQLNWLGYGSCKGFCKILLSHYSFNRNQTGLVFTSFDRYSICTKIPINEKADKNKLVHAYPQWLNSFVVLALATPNNTTASVIALEQKHINNELKYNVASSKVVDSVLVSDIKSTKKHSRYSSRPSNTLRISQHANNRIAMLYPSFKQDILNYCENCFAKYQPFVGNSSFNYVDPKLGLKLIIRHKILVTVIAKNANNTHFQQV